MTTNTNDPRISANDRMISQAVFTIAENLGRATARVQLVGGARAEADKAALVGLSEALHASIAKWGVQA